ncbi:Para-hydroxybenzoate--polyprenyltransferase, mitochondrial precursor (PHB:polyprenyltransferase) [Tulasnella sp. 332]|nr:Para-hydroxybenzoate--polyprenyltransferase, mitochondrial precursor (PHB:polyprenyltransferase) [Tulasnella sp. 332]
MSTHKKSLTASKKQDPALLTQIIQAVWPYIKLCRIDGLLGVWLTFWPCAWGAILAASYPGRLLPSQLITLLFGIFIGCALLHSAACTINDVFDRHVDGLVERTKHRPLVTGAISVRNAWVFLGFQVALFFYVLTWTNHTCAKIALANLPLQFTYPLAKRYTHWTSGILGLTFGWGSLVGWSAVTGSLSWANLPLYLAGVCWAMGYDTIYSHQDMADDPKAGVKSTAILLQGRSPRTWLTLLAMGFVSLLAITGLMLETSRVYLLAVFAAALHVGWQVCTVNLGKPSDCFEKFYSNSWIGFVMLPGLLLEYQKKLAV